MENYDYVSFLGQGSYGEVQLVRHVLEGKEVSLMVIQTFMSRFFIDNVIDLLLQMSISALLLDNEPWDD